jgi:sugar lactone lactonase YvrE
MIRLFIALLTCAVTRAELFVSSHNSSQVFRFHETTGVFIDIFIPNTDGRLASPHSLVFGPDGHFYVASAGNDRVLRYNGQTGLYIDDFVTANSGGLDYPVALVFRGTNLFVSSQLNDRVLRYNAATGAFLDTFVTDSPVLDGPSDMVFGPDGNLYVVGRFNNRVVRYNGETGALINIFIDSNLNQPFGLRFLTNGNLLVANGNLNAIQTFNSAGIFLQTLPNTGNLAFPIGIILGVDEILVARFNDGRVARLQMNGAFKSVITAPGLNGPNFMTFRPSVPPTLSINYNAHDVLLSWQGEGFHVVESESPAFTQPIHHPVGTNSFHSPAAQKFYRLEKPY